MSKEPNLVNFDELPIEDLHITYVGRVVENIKNIDQRPRVGIITDIIRAKLGTIKVVILWDYDHPIDHMLWGNADDLVSDELHKGAVDVVVFNMIAHSPRWKIFEEEWYGELKNAA